MELKAYIERYGVELEVTAELYDCGYGYNDSWSDTGSTYIVTHEPVFYKLYCEDDNGDDVLLTSEELETVKIQFIKQYWDNE